MKPASALFAAAAALAISSAIPARAQSGVQADGHGRFTAQGSGLAAIQGSGAFSIRGTGSLIVIAQSREEISGKGFSFIRQDGNRYYFEGEGRLMVKGRSVGLRAEGRNLHLSGAGIGAVSLRGEGTFNVNGSKGRWTRTGATLRFGRPQGQAEPLWDIHQGVGV